MIGFVSGQLQAEVGFDRGADVRGTGGVDAPAAVFVLVAHDPVGGFLKAVGIAGAEQRVQQNVIGFERGIGFEFAAPVAFFVLLRKKKFASGGDGGADTG